MDETQKPKGQRTTERMAPIMTHLELRDHVKILELAKKYDRTVSSVVRVLLKRSLRNEE